jgi:hypothetical protein
MSFKRQPASPRVATPPFRFFTITDFQFEARALL